MSEKAVNEKFSSNQEVINDITKNLKSQLTIKTENNVDSEDTEESCVTAITEKERNSGIPEYFEESDIESSSQEIFDDFVDEETLKNLEINLTEKEKEGRYKESLALKTRGNDEFKEGKYFESLATYTQALKTCPLQYTVDRSIFFANRAASKLRLNKKQSAVDDCSKAIELNNKYVKVYLRRAKLYEEMEKLDESLEDYKKILTLDSENRDALQAQYRLPPLIKERNEKLKTEMLGKLKDLGNVILKPFGLSTDNFKLNQDSESGGYSVNFVQNSGK